MSNILKAIEGVSSGVDASSQQLIASTLQPIETYQEAVDPCSTTNEEYSPPKNVQEAKKLLTTFRKKMTEYPKHMSYEGSMILCVLLAMKKVAAVNIRNLPSVDQTLIKSLLPNNTDVSQFDVKFDDNKDFVLIFNPQTNKDLTVTVFNTVAHPRPSDLTENLDVPVENDGEKIAVGGKIHLNKKNIQKLVGITPRDQHSEESDEKMYVPQQKQVGRNAYEIRADVLQMAIDWSKIEDGSKVYRKPTEDELLSLAKKFYSFVENRR